MMGRLTKPRLAAALVVAAVAGLSVSAASPALPRLILVNESPSLPRGVYLRAGDQRPRLGAVVAVEPPPAGRAYLSALGMPAGTPLLKRVAAAHGERVCRRGSSVEWPRGAVMALTRDRRGAPLPTWSGCRRLGSDELLVLGDTAMSFDSRYFGPVRRTALGGVYVEALTW